MICISLDKIFGTALEPKCSKHNQRQVQPVHCVALDYVSNNVYFEYF